MDRRSFLPLPHHVLRIHHLRHLAFHWDRPRVFILWYFPVQLRRYNNVNSSPRPGLYCVAFAVHARIRGTNKGGGTNIAIYPLSVLFTLCTVFCAVDTAQTLFTVSCGWIFLGVVYPSHLGALFFFQLRYQGAQDLQAGLTSYNMNIANTAMYCAITFIAQGILVCLYSHEGFFFFLMTCERRSIDAG